jgi:hypothetical protein
VALSGFAVTAWASFASSVNAGAEGTNPITTNATNAAHSLLIALGLLKNIAHNRNLKPDRPARRSPQQPASPRNLRSACGTMGSQRQITSHF